MFYIKNIQQILGMGGPYIGELFFDNILVTDNVVTNGRFKDIAEQRYYFVRWFKQSKWAKDICFRVCYFDINTGQKFYYKKSFHALFLVEKVSEKLKIYRAFHTSYERFKDEFDLSLSVPIEF